MKNTHFLSVLLIFLFVTVSFAQKVKEVKNEAVPKAVKDAFHTESMSDAPKKWEERTLKNGEVRYAAFYVDANFNARLVIKASGEKISRTFTGMENGPFNEACDAAALKQYPGYTIKKYEMVFIFAKEKNFFRDILEKDGKRAVFWCDGEGKPLNASTTIDEN
jgi:ABC-type transporter MlaC component